MKLTALSTALLLPALTTALTASPSLSIRDCKSTDSGALVCRSEGGFEVRIPREVVLGLTKRHETGVPHEHPHPEGNVDEMGRVIDEGEHDHEHEEDEHGHEEGKKNCHMHADGTEHCEEHSEEDHAEDKDAQAGGEHCHTHSDGTVHCDDEEDHAEDKEAQSGGKNCHFHAGVEHCEDDDAESVNLAEVCKINKRDYNIPVRIGAIFAVLVGSCIAVFLPIFLHSFANVLPTSLAFISIKQFGTGVIISTAFIHLLTHAYILFNNKCLTWDLFEPVAAAICMGGLFFSFLVEYIGNRIIRSRSSTVLAAANPDEETSSSDSGSNISDHDHAHNEPGHSHAHKKPALPTLTPAPTTMGCGGDTSSLHSTANDRLSVMVMEAGIIFHSILIGITLMVSGDSVFKTLLIVIVFHQAFEGLALGARIAALPSPETTFTLKMTLAGAFTLITPIGMAIGLGVLNKFNGNDPATAFTIAFLNAFSAGILVYVGVVEMLAHDWVIGELKQAPLGKTVIALAALLAGCALMSLLGNWI